MSRSAIRALTCLPACAALVWACVISVQTIFADDLLRQARTEMTTWAARGAEPDQSTREAVLALVEESVAIRSREPIAHELRGHLALAGPRDLGPRTAQRAFATALELRPVAPYTWAGLAQALYRAGEPGSNLEHAIVQAAMLGPSEPRIQRVVADLGLAVWDELTPQGRSAVDRTLAAGIRRNPLELLRISASRGRLGVACRHVVGAAAVVDRSGRYCERWETTP